MTDFLKVFKHLLPRSHAWELTHDRYLRQFFEGLAELPTDLKEYFDLIWLDLFPQTTRELDAWEYQWGLPDVGLTTQERRDRLDATWAQIGGQDPKYIQDTLQAAGFPVYIHEWWVPASSPVEARNPLNYLIGVGAECGEDHMECGETGASCGDRVPLGNSPSWLVNKVDLADYDWTIRCGEALAQCGEPAAQCGEYDGFVIRRRTYPIPENPIYWPYFLYFGGSTFGDPVSIPVERQAEFENLLLKLCPTQQWIGLFIDFYQLIVEDVSGDTLLEDVSGDTLKENP